MSLDNSALALVGVVFSFLSLGVSGTTMYYTWLRRGRLGMTKPTIVGLGHEPGNRPTAKIFLRTLLYSTAPQGKMVERMFARLVHGGKEQVLGVWGHGWTTELSPGSGLFVSQNGVSANHHFALSANKPDFEFAAGDYTIQVLAQQPGQAAPELLSELTLFVDDELAAALAQRKGVLFELEPDTQKYVGQVRGGQVRERAA